MLWAAREAALPVMTAWSPVTAWILDDTGLPKKGPHSVISPGNIAASTEASLPIAWRLYLVEVWANDPERRAAAKVLPEAAFAARPQIRAALAGAGYGNNSDFRDAIARHGLDHVMGAVPGHQQPHGSLIEFGAARAALERDAAEAHRTRACSGAATMSVL